MASKECDALVARLHDARKAALATPRLLGSEFFNAFTLWQVAGGYAVPEPNPIGSPHKTDR